MSDGRSGNPALGAMVGDGGDYCISALTTPTEGLIFSHIFITSDATITTAEVGDVKISDAGVATLPSVTSVKTSRHYTGTLPQGYLMCAGKDKAFKHTIKLATGSAEGIIFKV
jgi:hypothetical protein